MPPKDKESAGYEPKSPLQSSLYNLHTAYSDHLAGKHLDRKQRKQIAKDLTVLRKGLSKETRTNPDVVIFFQLAEPLAIDPQRPKGYSRKKKLALGGAALGVAALGTVGILMTKEVADLKASGGPVPIEYDGSKLFPGNITSDITIVPANQAPPATKTPEVQKPPDNLFNEFIKPFVEEAMQRRKSWENTDPEYSHIIDKELNENRLNIVVFGYGEEHGESYEDYGGAPTVFSLDLKTNKIAVVHFSRDIRAPQLERLLPADQRQPLSIRSVYQVGGKNESGFKQMRYLIGSMSGLVADYQIVMKDLVLRDTIEKLADGNLEIDVPKDHNTGPFRLDRIQYRDSLIRQGKQVMDTAMLMRYVLAEDKNPEGKQDERSYRKNQVTEALVKQVRNKLKGKSLFDKIAYLNQIKSLTDEELRNKNLELDFNPNLISKSFDGILRIAGKFILNLGQNIEMTVPEIDNSKIIVFHDLYFGDGGVTRVHNLANFPDTKGRKDNPTVLQEVKAHKLPDWMLIPDGGNPYSNDLVRDYWHSIRKMVKQTLTGTKTPP